MPDPFIFVVTPETSCHEVQLCMVQLCMLRSHKTAVSSCRCWYDVFNRAHSTAGFWLLPHALSLVVSNYMLFIFNEGPLFCSCNSSYLEAKMFKRVSWISWLYACYRRWEVFLSSSPVQPPPLYKDTVHGDYAIQQTVFSLDLISRLLLFNI